MLVSGGLLAFTAETHDGEGIRANPIESGIRKGDTPVFVAFELQIQQLDAVTSGNFE